MEKQFGLHFGALADPIAKQLKDQGFKFKKEQAAFFERLSNAATLCLFHGLMTDSQHEKARQKIVRKVAAHLKSLNP